MGLFDFFKKSEGGEKTVSPRELARLTRLVSSKLSQNYDRQEAIGHLAAMKTPEAARVLLKRFDFTMDPSITDQEEKEAAAEGVLAAGEGAIQHIRNYCASAESLTWPMKVLRKLVAEDNYVDELLELLEQFDTEYVRNAEPKVQLITALAEYPREEVRLGVEQFLTDVNENVRFHAVGTTFAMADAAACGSLVRALAEEESLRVRNRIATGLAEQGWAVPVDLQSDCRSALPDGFALRDGKVTR
jgi:hypothetical protein